MNERERMTSARREAKRAQRARQREAQADADGYLTKALPVGRGGWYPCIVCGGRHTATSKAGRSHREAAVYIAMGEEAFRSGTYFLSPAVSRLVEAAFAKVTQVKAAGVPDAFRQAFEGDAPWW